MFFLKKIFQLRDHANPNAEKPFLEHLEDLRLCITRIVLTLLVSTVVCFVFRNELMDIIRRPVVQVWESGQNDALKDTGIALQDWEKAKSIASAAIPLSPEERTVYLQHAAENAGEFLEDLRAVYYFRAAATLDGVDKRKEFVKALPGVEDALRSKVLALIDGNPSVQVDARGKLVLMQALKPTEGFMLSIKLAFFAGIVVSFPFLLYFLMQFVLPGMHDAERRALWPAMAVGFGLFLTGVFFAYFIVLPRVLEFFHEYSSGMSIENEWRIGYYISFATQFTLIFGLSFELPVLVMTLVYLGILNSQMMRGTRAYAILAIFVIAAIITPTPDAFTLCLLAGPMVILYEICIWLAVLLERRTRRREEEEEKERMARLLALQERRAALGEEDGDEGDDDGGDTPTTTPSGPHDPHGGGESPPGHDYGHGDDHEFGYDHDYDHDHDPEDYHHDPEHGHDVGEDHPDSDTEDDKGEQTKPASTPEPHEEDATAQKQQDFDFHEEVDPALTEEGEQEDISDPWPDSDDAAAADEHEHADEEEDEYIDPSNPPGDIPEEEKNREKDDPNSRDRD